MKKKILLPLGIIYIVFAIIITVFVFKRNSYGAFEWKDNYLICDSVITEYSNNSLVSFNKNQNIEEMVDKEIYYFSKSKELKKDLMKSYSTNDKVFMIDKEIYSTDHFLGLPSKGYILVGSIINFFTNKIVYLILIIIPAVLLLIYEMYLLFKFLYKNKMSRDNNE